MNRINFMPDSFLKAKALRRTLIRSGAIVIGGLLFMGAWQITARRTIGALDREIVSWDRKEASARIESEKVVAAKNKRLKRSKEAVLYDKVKMPVPTSSVVALVAQLMPPAMGLRSFSLVGEPVRPAAIKSKKKRRRKAKDSEQQRLMPFRLTLEGMAPSDLLIAKFIGHLDEQDLFVNVELAYSRPVEHDALVVREFQVTAEIPLDRTYRLESGQKVSRAD